MAWGEDTCKGAAAMDKSCTKERHLRSVFPAPREGLGDLWKTVYHPATVCREGLVDSGGLEACRVGVDPGLARRHVALIGDSHSAHWRPGVDIVARQRGWSVTSLYGSGCDFTSLTRYFGNNRPYCKQMRSMVPGWLQSHPEVDMVIFSQVSKQGQKEREGYKRAWDQMPASVKDVVVIRDNPHAGGPKVLKCVVRAQAAGRLPGPSCAKERSRVSDADAAYQAAGEAGSGKRHFYQVDLTDRFCSSKLCYPVLGGLLVYGWLQHQAPSFNRSLAPYLDQALPASL